MNDILRLVWVLVICDFTQGIIYWNIRWGGITNHHLAGNINIGVAAALFARTVTPERSGTAPAAAAA